MVKDETGPLVVNLILYKRAFIYKDANLKIIHYPFNKNIKAHDKLNQNLVLSPLTPLPIPPNSFISICTLCRLFNRK